MFTGAGKQAFCAGGDISSFDQCEGGLAQFFAEYNLMHFAISEMKPI